MNRFFLLLRYLSLISGENIRSLYIDKRYLEAAELISECTALLDNQYREISGLNEIKRNIETERIKLEKHLLMEATEQIYHSVTKDVLETGKRVYEYSN